MTDNLGATATASVAITATTDPNAIAAPSNLTGSGGKGSATLTWKNNANNETGFYVERAPSRSTTFVRVATLGQVTTYKNSVSRGTYQYRVQAFNSNTGLTSAYSNTVTVSVR